MIDAILPWRCVVCGLSCTGPGICSPCKAALPWNDGACLQCSLPMHNVDDLRCGACIIRPPVFDTTVSPLLFKFPVDRLIHKFKFQHDLAAGAMLGSILAENLALKELPLPDLVIPVPMHRFRLLHRGFNQSFELARQLGKALGVPVTIYELQRHHHTPTQTGLDAKSRRKNLKGAFHWRGNPLRGMRVALVDDVMTTGSTIAECSRVLKRSGANEVAAWTLARAVS